jgi:hypothetical protein
MQLKTAELELKTKTKVGIGRYFTQKVIQKAQIEGLLQHPQHGAQYATLQDNSVSNRILIEVHTKDLTHSSDLQK